MQFATTEGLPTFVRLFDVGSSRRAPLGVGLLIVWRGGKMS
jgi:hypothetical protein